MGCLCYLPECLWLDCSYNFSFWQNTLPKQPKKGEFIWVCSLKETSIVMEIAWQQKYGTDGHTIPMVRKQRETNTGVPLPCSLHSDWYPRPRNGAHNQSEFSLLIQCSMERPSQTCSKVGFKYNSKINLIMNSDWYSDPTYFWVV